MTTKQECDRRHRRLWGGIGAAVVIILSAYGALLGYGYTLGNKAAVTESRVEGLEEDVRETRRMVYDLWRENGGQE